MSIRRKSTAHDLATLRLHPDGSRVQQSSVNARHRRAGCTIVDPRGNWIAKDAGGKCSVKTRRKVTRLHADEAEREFIDLSGDEDAHTKSKGKQGARSCQPPPDDDAPRGPEPERLNTRARQRLSFMHDLSFLDPAPFSPSSLQYHSDATSAQDPAISFSDPASDLLKSIHHFASCYYRERGQLLDSSRDYRGKKKERHRKSQENIHILAANTREQQNTDSETEHTESEDGESEVMDIENNERDALETGVDAYRKDMYKAFDGSALMAIGIMLQEYVAHTLTSRPRTPEELGGPKRRKTG